MGLFRKEKKGLTKVSLYVVLVVILIEMYQTMADRQKNSYETKQNNRHKRQAGDIILMGYKAQKALKGTTKPSEFFNRIGKKWAGPSSLQNSDIYVRPDGYGDGLYLDDDYIKDW